MKIRLDFGKSIKNYRLKNSLTQLELAEKAGIQYKYLQRIEGKNPPAVRIDTIEKLAKALKIQARDLL